MKLIFLPDISFHNSKLEKKFKNFEIFLAKLNKNFSNAKMITNLRVFYSKKNKAKKSKY